MKEEDDRGALEILTPNDSIFRCHVMESCLA